MGSAEDGDASYMRSDRERSDQIPAERERLLVGHQFRLQDESSEETD